MAATTVDHLPAGLSVGLSVGLSAGVLAARAVDELLAGTGLVLEVERWPDERPAGLFPHDDEEFADAVADGLVACYEVSVVTASGDQLASAVVWSTAGVACGPYTSCSALGEALAEEVAEPLGRALLRR